jgi:acetate kinase
MENLGIVLDEKKNNANPKEGLISHDTSRIKVAVIPANEEHVVASEVKRYLADKRQ